MLVHLIWCQQFTATWVRAPHWLIAATLAVFLEVLQLPLPGAAVGVEGTSHQCFNNVSLDSSIRPELRLEENIDNCLLQLECKPDHVLFSLVLSFFTYMSNKSNKMHTEGGLTCAGLTDIPHLGQVYSSVPCRNIHVIDKFILASCPQHRKSGAAPLFQHRKGEA